MAAKIVKLALQSRLLVIGIQCVANILIPDHDAKVFNPPSVDEDQFTVADRIILFFLGGFRRWDAMYFLHVAQHGYTYENCVAFFPLYPIIISSSKSIATLCPYLSSTSLLLVTGVLVNVVLFVIAAVVLLRLGLKVTHDFDLAYLAAVLFCVNPASIFMTAPYTETLFACLSFAAMLCLRQEQLFVGVILIGASAFTRSNGLVSFGFVVHFQAAEYVRHLLFYYKVHGITATSVCTMAQTALYFGVKTCLALVIALSPFVIFQMHVYELFCLPENQSTESLDPAVIHYGRKEGLKLVGDVEPVSPWCFSFVPLSYSYIQSHYWGVGFMNYYQVKQIPNFILAVPIIGLSLCACYSFYLRRPDACRTLGLVEVDKHKVETIGSCEEERKSGWHSAYLVVYVLHLLFLTGFGCCFMHIQVLTRFLCSSSPVIYWFTAHILMCDGKQAAGAAPCSELKCQSLTDLFSLYRQCSTRGKCALIYFGGYFVIGTVAFSNFLPWT